MYKKTDKLLTYSFYLLFFLVPLVIYPKTSELFEFNKMILVYFITTAIVFLWVMKMVIYGKIIFKKSKLDIFLIIFFLSQLVSTLISVDPRTSLLGYYSRFHGGLLSTLSYLLLYWAYVSNMNSEKTKKAIYFTFSSAFLVSLWAVFEHFGMSFSCLIFPEFGKFDTSCWVQDVQNRVFATFGQPNWLAAWITALIPLTWSMILVLKSHKQNSKIIYWFILSAILSMALLFTKSRSGLLGFGGATVTFWLLIALMYTRPENLLKPYTKPIIQVFLSMNILMLILIAVFGTPWTPKLGKLLNNRPIQEKPAEIYQGPALEAGGTESGQIRKIVWKGALDIWKNNPVFGTGVETFAFSYYKHRPAEHNMVSEWNFLYNKAHNEYLNLAATTGGIGLFSFLLLITISLIQILPFKNIIQPDKTKNTAVSSETLYLRLGLFSGYVSILITNFFGFSVVGVALLFFLFPAMAVAVEDQSKDGVDIETAKLTNPQVSMIAASTIILAVCLHSIYKYWYADFLYAKGKLENDTGVFNQSRNTLLKAIEYSPSESVFWDELADTTASLAVVFAENGDAQTAQQLAVSAIYESDKALSLSPKSVILRKTRLKPLVKLSSINPDYMHLAKNTLLEAKKLAPTDAHISYNLAITYMRTGDMDTFYKLINDTIEMKPNYKDARYALAQYHIHNEDIKSAINEFEYILQNIDNDQRIETELRELKEKAQ